MQKLDEVPAGMDVVWFGSKWDNGCTDEIRVHPPEQEFCHGCYTQIGVRASGVAERQPDDRWLFYDPSCWGDVLNERYAKEALKELDADEEYEGRPNPKHW